MLTPETRLYAVVSKETLNMLELGSSGNQIVLDPRSLGASYTLTGREEGGRGATVSR